MERPIKYKDWLSNNITSLLALIVVVVWAVVELSILFRPVKTTDTTTMMILTNTTSVVMLVLGFYYISSKSSKDKDKQIADIIASKAPVQDNITVLREKARIAGIEGWETMSEEELKSKLL